MATPRLTKFSVPGALGPILIDVRTGDGPARPTVLVLHGFKGFKDWGMFPSFSDRLARAGFTAVSFNVSGSGVDETGTFALPERFGHNTFGAELIDIERVLAALDAGELGVSRPSSVGLVGHSRGGGVGILAANRFSRLRALVTWAAIGHVVRWGPGMRDTWRAEGKFDVTNARTGEILPLYTDLLDEVEQFAATDLNILAAAAEVTVPWLVVHGAADESVPIREGELLRDASTRAEFLRIDGTGHTFGAVHPFAGRTPALDKAFDASIDFLRRNLT